MQCPSCKNEAVETALFCNHCGQRLAGLCKSCILSALILLIGYIMIGVRRDKRGLHDLMADTVVVKR